MVAIRLTPVIMRRRETDIVFRIPHVVRCAIEVGRLQYYAVALVHMTALACLRAVRIVSTYEHIHQTASQILYYICDTLRQL